MPYTEKFLQLREQSMRRQRRLERMMGVGIAAAVSIAVTFWILVGFIAYHFISKWW